MSLGTVQYQTMLDIRNLLRRQVSQSQGISPQAYAELRAQCLYLADLVNDLNQDLDREKAWREWAEDTLRVRAEKLEIRGRNLANAEKYAEDLKAFYRPRDAAHLARIAELERENQALRAQAAGRAA